MSTYRDLVSVFGEKGVVTLKYDELRSIGVSPSGARALAHTGIPRLVKPAFSVHTEGEPPAFSVHEFDVGGEGTKVLVIGAPPGDQRMRYFLDVYDGVVGLFGFFEQGTQVDVVNSTIDDFIEFVYVIGSYDGRLQQAGWREYQELVEEIYVRLKDQDPFAFADRESWWSVVLDQMKYRKGDVE